jgi:hypothetical protein
MCSGCAESYLLPNRKIQEREKKKQRERHTQTQRKREEKTESFLDELYGDLL